MYRHPYNQVDTDVGSCELSVLLINPIENLCMCVMSYVKFVDNITYLYCRRSDAEPDVDPRDTFEATGSQWVHFVL